MNERESDAERAIRNQPLSPTPNFDFANSDISNWSVEMVESAIGKMSILRDRMNEFCKKGAPPGDYEVAIKIGDAAQSALQILQKYATTK